MFLYNFIFHFDEVRGAQLTKTALLTSMLVPWDLFRSFKVCSDAKESGVRKATGSYRTFSVPDKTAVLVSEFAMEDLPLAELQARFRRLQ